MHILHTVLCTFPKVLARRIYLTIKSFFREKLDARYSQGSREMYFTDRRASRQGVRVSVNTSCIGQFMIHKQDLSITLTFTN